MPGSSYPFLLIQFYCNNKLCSFYLHSSWPTCSLFSLWKFSNRMSWVFNGFWCTHGIRGALTPTKLSPTWKLCILKLPNKIWLQYGGINYSFLLYFKWLTFGLANRRNIATYGVFSLFYLFIYFENVSLFILSSQ